MESVGVHKMVFHIPVKYEIPELEISFEIEKCDCCKHFTILDDLEILEDQDSLALVCETCIERFSLQEFILQ